MQTPVSPTCCCPSSATDDLDLRAAHDDNGCNDLLLARHGLVKSEGVTLMLSPRARVERRRIGRDIVSRNEVGELARRDRQLRWTVGVCEVTRKQGVKS